jgi:type I restriction enzyme S subunit
MKPNSSWQELPISKVANITLGGTPKRVESEFWNGSIKWATAKDIANCPTKHIRQTEEKISELGLQKSNAKLMPKGTVVITARGTVGEIRVLGEPMTFNQTCYGLTPKNKLIDNEFLYYALKNTINIMKTLSYGTVFETITIRTFDEFTITIPSFQEQRKIADILSSLDDKIELNYEMNKTLEAIAQAIFKNWFVDFEPFKNELVYNEELHKEIPKGWEVRPISDFCECYRGMSYQTEYLDKGEGILLTLSVLKADGGVNYKEIRRYDEKQIKERYRIAPGDLLVGMTDLTSGEKMLGAPLLVPHIIDNKDVKLSCVHHFCILKRKCSSYLNNAFFYFLFKQNNFRKLMNKVATGTTVRQIVSERIAEFLFSVPPLEIVNNFQILFDVISRLIELHDFESQTLSNIRDSLIPKLLSGEIMVKVDVEKEFPDETKKLEEIKEEKSKIQKSILEWR